MPGLWDSRRPEPGWGSPGGHWSRVWQGLSRHGQCPHPSPAHIPCPSSVHVLWLRATATPIYGPPWPLCGRTVSGAALTRRNRGATHMLQSLAPQQVGTDGSSADLMGCPEDKASVALRGWAVFVSSFHSPAQDLLATRPSHPLASSMSSSGGAKEDSASHSFGPCP